MYVGADPFWLKACILVFCQGVQYTKLNCMFIYSFIIQQLLFLVELTREELIHKSMKSRCATSNEVC